MSTLLPRYQNTFCLFFKKFKFTVIIQGESLHAALGVADKEREDT